jgi:GTP-binding protein
LGHSIHAISAETGEGIEVLLRDLMTLVAVERARAAERPPEEIPVLRPPSEERFSVHPAGEGRFVVEGRRVVTFVEMMDTDMEGSRDEINRRLERWGVMKALRRAGARDGDTVAFGEVELIL